MMMRRLCSGQFAARSRRSPLRFWGRYQRARHREERSDAAIQGIVGCPASPRLLRHSPFERTGVFRRPMARNDDRGSTQPHLALVSRRKVLLLAALLACLAGPALAVQPEEVMKDPALEARARTLSAELRCLVCQNQSIDDFDAPLARDVRILILVWTT